MTGKQIIENFSKPNAVALASIHFVSSRRSVRGLVIGEVLDREISRLTLIAEAFEAGKNSEVPESKEFWAQYDLMVAHFDAAEYLTTHVWGRP